MFLQSTQKCSRSVRCMFHTGGAGMMRKRLSLRAMHSVPRRVGGCRGWSARMAASPACHKEQQTSKQLSDLKSERQEV